MAENDRREGAQLIPLGEQRRGVDRMRGLQQREVEIATLSEEASHVHQKNPTAAMQQQATEGAPVPATTRGEPRAPRR